MKKCFSFPHIQISEIKDFKYNYGPISNEDEDSVPKNYFRMAASFKEDLEKFDTDIKSKYRTKDQSLNIPYDIDFILITFQGTFSIKDTWKKYFNDFGLEHLLSTISVEKDYLPLQIVKNSRHSSPTFTTLLNMNWKEIKLFNIQAI